MEKKTVLKMDYRLSIYDRRMLYFVTYSPERRYRGDRRSADNRPSTKTERLLILSSVINNTNR
jgi:hypothetical protein